MVNFFPTKYMHVVLLSMAHDADLVALIVGLYICWFFLEEF